MYNWWTKEIEQFLIDNVKGISVQELTERINSTFGTQYSCASVSHKKSKLGVKSGWNGGCYKKGVASWNKGIPMRESTRILLSKTYFQREHIPDNSRELFSERVNKDGLIDIKVTNFAKKNNWMSKHQYIWEQAHGEKLNKGEVIIFLDGNKRNFAVENLEKVTRAELCKLNQLYGISSNADETKSHILMVRIMLQRARLARKNGMVDKHGLMPVKMRMIGTKKKKE